jgi:hypothetical protein
MPQFAFTPWRKLLFQVPGTLEVPGTSPPQLRQASKSMVGYTVPGTLGVPGTYDLKGSIRMDWTATSITRIELDPYGRTVAWIECPPGLVPAAGQYVLARASEDETASLARALFPSELAAHRFQTGGLPPNWGVGTPLVLRGPLGRGFALPEALRRLVLANLGEDGARLRPLMDAALAQGAEVTLFDDQRPRGLPPAVEAFPLSGLVDALPWADFLALHIPYDGLAQLNRIFGPRQSLRRPLPAAQALVSAPMPCAGCADCGACAVQTRPSWKPTSWKLTCTDGPVFNLEELDW